jgi:hypothetical protein
MNSKEAILEFLSGQQDITLGYSEINFFKPASLDAEQVGYSFNPKGESLVTGKQGDWQASWTVIASDEASDPLFVDTAAPELPVMVAAHGMGTWEPEPIADSLHHLAGILTRLRVLAAGRENPVKKLLNPLSAQEAAAFVDFVKTANPNSDSGYWETIMLLALENDTE